MRVPLRDAAAVTAVAASVALTAIGEGGQEPRFLAAAGLLAWWCVLVMVVLDAGRLRLLSRTAAGAIALFTLYGAWAVASAVWAADAGGAATDGSRFLTYAGIFSAVVLLAQGAEARLWARGLTVGLVLVGVIAAAARFFPALETNRELFATALPGAQERLGYPIGYWNALGTCMAMALVLLAAYSAEARYRAVRALCTTLIPLTLLVIFLASSRASLVAAALGVLVLVLVLPGRGVQVLAGLAIAAPATLLITALANDQPALLGGLATSSAKSEGLTLLLVTIAGIVATFAARYLLDDAVRSIRLPRLDRRVKAAGAVIVLATAVVAANPAERWEAFKEPPNFVSSGGSFTASHLQSTNGNGRYQFWGTAVDAFGEDPVLGQGAGGYTTYWNQHGDLEYRLRDAHSIFLETAAELGAVGLLAIAGFFALVALAARRGVLSGRREGDPTAGMLTAVFVVGICGIAVDWSWEIPAVALPILIVSALLLRSDPEVAGPADAESPRGAWLRPALAAGAVAALIVVGHALLLQGRLEESRERVGAGELAAGAEAARAAQALAPWAAEPRVQQALIAEKLGDTSAARQEIAAAIDRSPEDWRLRVISSRLALEAGEASDAVAALRQARRLNPRSAVLAPRPPPPGLIPSGRDAPDAQPGLE